MRTAFLVWLLLCAGIMRAQVPDSLSNKKDSVSKAAAPVVKITPYGFLGGGTVINGDTMKIVSPPNWGGVVVETQIGSVAVIGNWEMNIGAPEWNNPKFFPRDRSLTLRMGKWQLWGGVFDRLWSYSNVRYLSVGDLRTVIHPGFREAHIELVRSDGPYELSIGAWEKYFSVAGRVDEGPFRLAATHTSLSGDEWWKLSARYKYDSLTATVLYERGEEIGRSTVASHVALSQPAFVAIASGGWRKQAGKATGFAVAELDWNLFQRDWSDLISSGTVSVVPRQQFQVVPFAAAGWSKEGLNLFRSGLSGWLAQIGVKIRF